MTPAFSPCRELGHLAQRAGAAASPDQVVRQDHAERLVADDRLGAQHGVAETERFGLRDEHAAHIARQCALHEREQRVLAGFGELAFELVGLVEVIRDRVLVAVGHEHQRVGARVDGFVDRVLDQRPVEHRQHFLGDDLGRRQEARAEAGDGKDDLAQRSTHRNLLKMTHSSRSGVSRES